MSDLILIGKQELARRQFSAIQFVPSLPVLQRAFEGLVPPHLTREDFQKITVEITQSRPIYGGLMEEHQRIVSAELGFARIKENGKDIWLYYGPVKEW